MSKGERVRPCHSFGCGRPVSYIKDGTGAYAWMNTDGTRHTHSHPIISQSPETPRPWLSRIFSLQAWDEYVAMNLKPIWY